MATLDDNLDKLFIMGFTDREMNRKALSKADNDISEAVTILTGSTFFNDDVIIPTENTSTFIGPLTKEQLEQQQQQNHPVSQKKKKKEN